MIKYFICFAVGIISTNSFSQDDGNVFTEFDLNYYYCFFGGGNNKFNYGASILFSKRIDKIKLSSGLNYSGKSYYLEFDPASTSDGLMKRTYKMDYINIPILVTFGNRVKDSYNFNLQSGFIANIPVQYSIDSYYINNPPQFEKDLDIGNIVGWTFRLGLNISKSIGQRMFINLSPFFDFKCILNGGNTDPNSYKNFPDDRLSVGLKLGLEYAIN